MGLGQALSNILEEHCSSFLSLILSWFYILIFLSNCILSCARSVNEYSDNKLNFILQNSILFIVKKIKLKKKKESELTRQKTNTQLEYWLEKLKFAP